jgi:ABC-type uncharacterized transport system substrate-binding protein
MSRSPALAAVFLLLFTSATAAQMPAKTARIGMLCPVRCVGPGYAAFGDELGKLGWVEGKNLMVERKEAEGRSERYSALIAEAVRARPDVITAPGSALALAAKQATTEIPIVFSFVADPVGVGLVESLARPGGNITGAATLVPGGLLAKNFQTVRELLPNAQRFAILTNPADASARLGIAREVPIALQYGLQIDVIEVRTREEVPGAIERAKALGADVVYVTGDAIFQTPPTRVPELMAQARLPAIYMFREMVQAGGLIAYSSDFLGIARRQAQLVDRVLRGSSPAEIPVDQPTKYDLVVNLNTAKALGLTIPPLLLARADEVIE